MATIKDVAERAGVAPSTVSYVLSGSRKISEDTRRAVRAAIDELGYHPRASARTLRSARTDVIALAVPRVPGEYRAVDGRFAIDITDAARGHGYDVLLMTDLDGVGGLRRVARSGLADGAVLMAVEEDDPRIAALRELGFPTALLGHDDHAALPWTDLDWEAAVALAVREAAAAGHRRVVFLASAEHEIDARRGYALRGLDGARQAAAETGTEVRVVESHREPAVLGRRLREALGYPCPSTGSGVPGPRPSAGSSATPSGAPTALVAQHLTLLPHILDAVPGHLAVIPVGSLPDDLGVRNLPRIDLPVAEMSTAVARLAVEAITAAAGPRPAAAGGAAAPGTANAPTGSALTTEPPHHLIPPRMSGPAVAPPRAPKPDSEPEPDSGLEPDP
ncbi:LacI family DNA-binding transcriptional regulator [Streptomyces pathocidini]|uniref:LacI family DNA-binding transcriptional regulator n=1 Tax=Streptomyces pathocidini TaxID=1650571 RepID=A0ABW7UPH0_9ACTN